MSVYLYYSLRHPGCHCISSAPYYTVTCGRYDSDIFPHIIS